MDMETDNMIEDLTLANMYKNVRYKTIYKAYTSEGKFVNLTLNQVITNRLKTRIFSNNLFAYKSYKKIWR